MIRLHNFPRREIERDVAIVQLLRDENPDYLIKDIWNIVCLFLFGGSKNLIISVPFGSLIYNGNWLFPWTKYISCFYGVEDTNGGFDLIIDGQQVSVSGRYPLRRCDFDNGQSMQIGRDLGQRAVLKLSFVHEKQKVVEKWFTWHWSGSKTFYSLEQANLSRTYRSMIPIFHTKNGHFDVFHPGYNENTILRILPTDEFHDCLRSSYRQCLQVHPQDFSP